MVLYGLDLCAFMLLDCPGMLPPDLLGFALPQEGPLQGQLVMNDNTDRWGHLSC